MEGIENKNIRLNKEYKVLIDEPVNLKFGAVDFRTPEVIYINGVGYIKPLEVSEDYGKDIRKSIKDFKQAISNQLSRYSYFDDNYILNFDVKENGFKKNKNSFLAFEIYLKQDRDIPFLTPLVELKDVIQDFLSETIHVLCESLKENDFLITPRKKINREK